jgi:hypothetical protein
VKANSSEQSETSFVESTRDDKRNSKGALHILKRKRQLEGIWENDLLKCGSYYDEQENRVCTQATDTSGTTEGMIRILELGNAEEVVTEAETRSIQSHSFSPI